MFEKPQKAQVVRIKIEAVPLDSTSVAPSLDAGSWYVQDKQTTATCK